MQFIKKSIFFAIQFFTSSIKFVIIGGRLIEMKVYICIRTCVLSFPASLIDDDFSVVVILIQITANGSAAGEYRKVKVVCMYVGVR